MDLSGGVVNQLRIDVLWRAEQLGKYGPNSYMVSSDKIKKLQDIVHKYMDKYTLYKLLNSRDGVDCVEFNKKQSLVFLLLMFKLYGIAQQEGNVKIGETVDREVISRNGQHVTCGVKILDPRSINLLNGIPIGFKGVQSQEYSFPLKGLLARGTKALYQTHFKDFFEWSKELHEYRYGDFKHFH